MLFLFAQLDPAQYAQGISQSGLAYILVVSVGSLAAVCIILYKALMVEKDKRLTEKDEHAKHVETLYTKQLDTAEANKVVMEKVFAMLERIDDRPEGRR